MANNMILVSGGPGLFHTGDVEHDRSWANYVTPPLLLTDTAAKQRAFEDGDDVWWLIYKPAYEARWVDDVADGRKSVKEVAAKGFSSYVDQLEGRAGERGWNLRWFGSAEEFWAKMSSFNDPIRRVVYWGHGRDDLWLSIRRDGNDAIAPRSHEIIETSAIRSYAESTGPDGRKMRLRYPTLENRKHDWIGCNTDTFAEEWAKRVRVWSQGVDGKVDFSTIHTSGGEPSLVGSGKIKTWKISSFESSGTSW